MSLAPNSTLGCSCFLNTAHQSEFNVNEPQLPPLSIRHFLYLTLGIAIAIWFNLRGLRVQPATVAAGVALASRAVSAFEQGGTIAAFLWLTARWLTRRPVKLQDPGATYVFVLSLNQFLALVGGIIVFLIVILENRNNRWSQWLLLPTVIAGAVLVAVTPIYGAIRAREWSWRIIFVCVFLLSAISIFQIGYLVLRAPNSWSLIDVAFALRCVRILVQTMTIVAVIVSLFIDWRRKTQRHWLHYFGIGLLALSSIQFLLQLSPQIAKLTIFRSWKSNASP